MIKVICIGNLKEKYLQDASNEYLKRIKKYQKIEIIEIDDNNTDKGLNIEKEEIFKKLNEKDYIIVLDLLGKELNTIEFADLVDKTFNNFSNITFIIGSSNGLHKEVKNKANYILSFSKLTFPHQLFRIILLEQIYRIFKINNNETYHK